ncbi:MAG: hypothetical protein NT076_00270 [Candidatus Pacearchaeota archaeon]|nr:hypothetical protein [Candidatus Pacearchaeota archaeon]
MEFSSWRDGRKNVFGNLADVATFDVVEGILGGTGALHNILGAGRARESYDTVLQLGTAVATSVGGLYLYYHFLGIRGFCIPLLTNAISGIRYFSRRRSLVH